jgi:hypothetical protein
MPPLTDKGIPFAVAGDSTKEQYNQIKSSYGCSRYRLFGVDPTISTMNKPDRGQSNGEKNVDFRQEYDKFSKTAPGDRPPIPIAGGGMDEKTARETFGRDSGYAVSFEGVG